MPTGQLYFTQGCQVCGRPMRVRLDLLGQSIHCGHCNAVCKAGQEPVESRAFSPLTRAPAESRRRPATRLPHRIRPLELPALPSAARESLAGWPCP